MFLEGLRSGGSHGGSKTEPCDCKAHSFFNLKNFWLQMLLLGRVQCCSNTEYLSRLIFASENQRHFTLVRTQYHESSLLLSFKKVARLPRVPPRPRIPNHCFERYAFIFSTSSSASVP